MQPLSIAVIGCGFAGAAAALLLHRAGHAVTIYEAVAEPGPIGAGILLQPTGLAVLEALGCAAPVLARGAPIEALRCVNTRGRELFALRYGDLSPGLHGIGLHRGVLFEVLFHAVKAAGIPMRLGVHIEDLGRDGAQRTLLDRAGEQVGSADLVVVADGARSELHDDTALRPRSTPYPYGALWFVAEDPERRFGRELFQVVRGTSRMTGFLPTGMGPASEGSDQPLVSFFFSIRVDAIEAWRRGDHSAWRREIAALDPRAPAVIEQIGGPDALIAARYRDTVMRVWHTEDVVYIGDSAHAMSPQLGQGTNLALLDGFTLAATLDGDGSLAEALARYSALRRDHVRFYQFASRWLTPLFQSDLDWLGPARDLLLPLGVRLPFARQQMLRTLAGVKRGVLRRDLPLDTLGLPALLGDGERRAGGEQP